MKENSLKFDSKLDAQRKNQLEKLRRIMNARRKKTTTGTVEPDAADQHSHQAEGPNDIPAQVSN